MKTTSRESFTQTYLRTRTLLNSIVIKNNFWFVCGVVIFVIGMIVEIYLLMGPWLDLNTKAALGDAINGLTAPLIGIIGAVLIYISFKEQVRTNRFQFQSLHQQREWDLLYRLYEELKADLSNLQPYYGGRYQQSYILDFFMTAVLEDKSATSPYPDLSKYLEYIFKQFSFLSVRICSNDVLGNNEKLYLIEKVRQIFNLYFESYYSKIVDHEYSSKFSTSFKQSLSWGGKAIIDLNALSMEILKEKFKNKSVKKD